MSNHRDVDRSPSPHSTSKTATSNRSLARAGLVVLVMVASSAMVALPPVAAQGEVGENLRSVPSMHVGTLLLGNEHAHVLQDKAGLWLETADAELHAIKLPAGIDGQRLEIGDAQSLGDRWFVSGIDRSGDQPRLALLTAELSEARDDLRTLTVPETSGPELMGTTLVTDANGPLHLLWLEGDRFDALAVHAARFDNGTPSAVDVISPPGPGSQVSITATLLADGSTLVAWAGYDGDDDEIWWSRSTRDGWSAPARIASDDETPDVTPSLIATDDGALIVWSAYDGRDYRLQAARFVGGAWDAPKTFGGRGSVFPTFVVDASQPTLLYKTAVPRTWTIQQLGTNGVPGAKAEIERSSNRRPRVDVAREAVTLSWPGQTDRPSAKLALTPAER